MFTFLPRTYKVEVEREYRKRLLTVGWGLFFALMFSAAALSLPSYVIMLVKKTNAESAFEGSGSPAPETVDFESQVKDIQAKATLLSTTFENKPLVSILELVSARVAQPGISITGISLKRGGAEGDISLSGVASTRDALVNFSKALAGEPAFKNVSLPISSLAKSRDIPFSIVVNSQF